MTAGSRKVHLLRGKELGVDIPQQSGKDKIHKVYEGDGKWMNGKKSS